MEIFIKLALKYNKNVVYEHLKYNEWFINPENIKYVYGILVTEYTRDIVTNYRINKLLKSGMRENIILAAYLLYEIDLE